MVRVLVALTLLLVAVSPSVARADAAAQARFHDQQAREHYRARRYEEALTEFFLEQRLAPNPRVLFNIALCFAQLGRDAETFLFYSEYLASSDDDASRRQRAQAALDELSERLARVRVVTEPAGAEVFVDQRDRGTYGTTPILIPVEAGARQVTVELDGYRPASQTVEAIAGREIELRLELEQIVGTLRVGAPAGATVVIRNDEGHTVAEGPASEAVPLPPGSYSLVVSADGRVPWRSVARVRAGETSRIDASLDPLPAPTGAVTITSNAAGALVTVDGEPVGFAPLALPAVEVGAHEVTVSQEGLRPWEGSVDVNADERAWLTVSLSTPPSTSRSELTWAAGGLGAAATIAGFVMMGFAADTHAQWEQELSIGDSDEVIALAEQGAAFNTAADVLFGVGIAGLAAGVLLFFLTEDTVDEPSEATVAREER